MQALGRGISVEQNSGSASALKEAGELEEAQHKYSVELQLNAGQGSNCVLLGYRVKQQ